MDNEDFSLKWFGVPDAQVVAIWKQLRPISKEQHERWLEDQKRIAEIYRLAARGVPEAIRWTTQEHFNRLFT